MELSQPIDPEVCLRQQDSFEGVVDCHKLTRLVSLLSEPVPEVSYNITFERDLNGRCIVNCGLTGSLNVICQRCGKDMQLPVTINSQLCAIASDMLAKKVPSRYEPLVLEEGMVSLAAIIEEELTLAIPMIPRHNRTDCTTNRQTT